MKTVKVVAVVIYDSPQEKKKYLLQPRAMRNLKTSGNF
jgi:hypothetical protein